MSVGEDQTECPLCMEPLEMDDINFFPCTCGYQICRFCWHRIRTDENGLCPACRKGYPEDPAEFKPLTEDELQRIKKERRQKEAQRKQKAAENRKHLANVRVVQKNLVFVVGLSQRLADPEVLKKHEYFGKFGKIHKVVINQSTSYAGAQGPSASAYVTYHRPEDALKAIQAVNNIHVDGRTLKASLGTTKYCSHFLRGAGCPKPDCMYLHELGEEAASFTKEEMQQGKHQEYEQKLYEQFMNSQNLVTTTTTPTVTPPVNTKQQTRKKTSSPELEPSPPTHTPPPQSTTEAWPSLQLQTTSTVNQDTLTNGNKAAVLNSFSEGQLKTDLQNAQNRAPGFHRNNGQHPDTNSKPTEPSPDLSPSSSSSGSGDCTLPHTSQAQYPTRSNITTHLPTSSSAFPARGSGLPPPPGLVSAAVAAAVNRKLPFQNISDSMSLFSSTNGFPARPLKIPPPSIPDEPLSTSRTEMPDTHIPVSSSTDWQAAFGFTSSHVDTTQDDDLGFDPWNESAKALAEIIEKESAPTIPQHQKMSYNSFQHSHSPHSPSSPRDPQLLSNMHHISQILDNRPKCLPPGFTPNHIGAPVNNHVGMTGSKIMNLMQIPSVPPQQHLPNNAQHQYNDILHNDMRKHDSVSPQDGLRALLPNINISFGGPQQDNTRLMTNRSPQPPPPQHQMHQKHWNNTPTRSDVPNWDPAIVTASNVTDYHTEETPHWMASLQHLTEDTSLHSSNPSHQMPPLMHQFAYRNTAPGWPKQTSGLGGPSHPPPGFHNPQMRTHNSQLTPEVSQLADGFQ